VDDVRRGIERFLLAPSQHHFGAVLGKAFGHSLSNAATAAGYKGNAPFEEPVPKDARHEGSRIPLSWSESHLD
jgi:hypothetical protein